MEIHENGDGSVRWIQPYTLENLPKPGDVVFLKRFDSDFIIVGEHVVVGYVEE